MILGTEKVWKKLPVELWVKIQEYVLHVDKLKWLTKFYNLPLEKFFGLCVFNNDGGASLSYDREVIESWIGEDDRWYMIFFSTRIRRANKVCLPYKNKNGNVPAQRDRWSD